MLKRRKVKDKKKTLVKHSIKSIVTTQQQRTASEFLKSSAKNLKRLVEVEQTFWDEALDLRRNNWLMQANAVSPAMGGLSVSNAGTSFLIRYGYTDGKVVVVAFFAFSREQIYISRRYRELNIYFICF